MGKRVLTLKSGNSHLCLSAWVVHVSHAAETPCSFTLSLTHETSQDTISLSLPRSLPALTRPASAEDFPVDRHRHSNPLLPPVQKAPSALSPLGMSVRGCTSVTEAALLLWWGDISQCRVNQRGNANSSSPPPPRQWLHDDTPLLTLSLPCLPMLLCERVFYVCVWVQRPDLRRGGRIGALSVPVALEVLHYIV